jgi:5-aminolevulinate synthase
MACDLRLSDYGISIEPIHFPTVPRELERLRIAPAPNHDNAQIDRFAEAPVDVWGTAQTVGPVASPRRGIDPAPPGAWSR